MPDVIQQGTILTAYVPWRIDKCCNSDSVLTKLARLIVVIKSSRFSLRRSDYFPLILLWCFFFFSLNISYGIGTQKNSRTLPPLNNCKDLSR